MFGGPCVSCSGAGRTGTVTYAVQMIVLLVFAVAFLYVIASNL